MSPFYVKDNSRHKASGQESKMCRHSHQHEMKYSPGMTNFPPITETNKLATHQASPHRVTPRAEKTRCEPHPPSHPRSNSDYSSGDLWSIGRRSISSSNGHSSISFSSGDNSTAVSTDKLWRRRRLSPRRMIRPVTPFPAEEELRTSPDEQTAGGTQVKLRVTPQMDSTAARQPVKARRKTGYHMSMLNQPIAEEQSTGKITANHSRRSLTEDPATKQKKAIAATKSAEQRRRKSMPDIRPKGEAPETKTDSRKEALVLTEIMDGATRDRIMLWLTEVKCATDEKHQDQDTLSSIDEE